MIVRIVKMTFDPEKTSEFSALFEERCNSIRNFEGCTHLELWQDAHQEHVFFTYSVWENESALNHYRFSELFKDTWTRTKQWFAAKPEAWSLERKRLV